MATVTKVLYRGSASLSDTALYTAPTGVTSVVTNIVIVNKEASTQTFSILLDGVELQDSTQVPANMTAYIELKQTIPSGTALSGSASSTNINFHISGVEVS